MNASRIVTVLSVCFFGISRAYDDAEMYIERQNAGKAVLSAALFRNYARSCARIKQLFDSSVLDSARRYVFIRMSTGISPTPP